MAANHWKLLKIIWILELRNFSFFWILGFCCFFFCFFFNTGRFRLNSVCFLHITIYLLAPPVRLFLSPIWCSQKTLHWLESDVQLFIDKLFLGELSNLYFTPQRSLSLSHSLPPKKSATNAVLFHIAALKVENFEWKVFCQHLNANSRHLFRILTSNRFFFFLGVARSRCHRMKRK